jgi:hypothetical protein
MTFTVLSPQVRKVGAVGIATLMLSTLAHAADSATGVVSTTVTDVTDLLNGKPQPVPIVPEANAAWVLIPVVAAMLFFSIRRLWSAKAAPGTEGQKGSR